MESLDVTGVGMALLLGQIDLELGEVLRVRLCGRCPNSGGFEGAPRHHRFAYQREPNARDEGARLGDDIDQPTSLNRKMASRTGVRLTP